ncbi:MAG: GAF domain-containing protein, partial [Anaerolineae bacterium]|nr:GAF domain-containing protein [Anaerolineae bacterium]
SEIQRAPDIPSRLQVVADGIHAAGWGRVAITLRGPEFEPAELITAGFGRDEAARLRASLLSGVVWRERLADPEFRRYRIGQAYYVRHSDPLVTENKLMAGIETPASDEPATPDRWHRLDTLYLPLYGLDQSRLVGIIAMDSPQDGKPPSEAELRPIELFAAQAAFAIENTRLYQGMTQAAQQEARINEVTEAVTATLELNEIIQGVAAGLHQMIPFSRMSVGLMDENAQRFSMLHVHVDAQGDAHIEPGGLIVFEDSAMGRAVQEAAGHAYDLSGGTDGEQPDDFADLRALHEAGEKAALVAPMMAGGRIVGALNMASRTGGAEELEAQLPLVSRIANLTAVAIENAQLFQQTIERERFSSALTRVGASVNTMLNMGHVLSTVCEESIAILGVAGAYVWLAEDDALTGIAARGPGEANFPGTRVRLDEADILGKTVIQERSPAYINVLEAGDEAPQSTIMARVLKDVPVGAMLAVPLVHENRATGAIVFIQTSTGKGFAETDIEKASAFASQAAIATENARLYQETLGLKSFNEAVVESIQQGIIVLNRDKTIRTVNGYMRKVYGWTEDALGQTLFAYRPRYMDFLQSAIDRVLHFGEPESRYGIRDEDEQGQPVVRNFYVYPLQEGQQEGQTVSGIVILVEDVTQRAALEADIARRERQLTVLTEISTQLTSTLDPDAVTRLMLDNTDRILDFDCATLWLRNEDRLVIQAARGYADAKALIGIEAEIADSELFRELAMRGQVLNIPDITMDSRFPPMSESHPMRSWLGISLVSRGRLAGLLVLEKSEPGFYTPTMEQLALTFANQVAVALENADLFQKTIQAADENTRLYRETASRARELDQQAQRLSLLYRVSNALTQSLDLEDVYEVALRETIGLLGVDRGSAFFFDNETRSARLVIEYPRRDYPPSEGDSVPLEGNPVLKQLRATLQPIVVRDVLADPRLNGHTPGGRQALSCLIVPLTVSGQIIGMLEFYHQQEYRDFTPEQVEVAQTIASQAAIAVQNANLLEQSLARTRELELLFDATQAISASLELDTVLRSIAMQMIIAMDVDACQILNYNAFDEALKVSVDIPAEASPVVTDAPGAVFRMADNLTMRRAMQTSQVILQRADDAKVPDAEREILRRRQVHSRVLVPMHVREQPVGLLTLDVCSAARTFTGGEVRLARTLSAQAAVAIENAGLQTETASKLEELFVINELSTALAANIDQEGVYDIVRQRLPALIKAQWFVVATLDPATYTLSYPVALRNGVPVEIDDHPLGDDEISFVVKQRMPQRLAGDEINDVLRNAGARLRIIPARCFMGVPMTSAEQPIGALVIGDENNPSAFNLNDQRILSTVGAQIAVALQNARLFTQSRQFAAELERAVMERTEELQRERDSISFLYQLTANLTSSLDIDITLNRALSMMTDAIGADRGAILGIDSISDRLIYRAGYELPFKEGQAAGLSPREGLAGWVIQTQRSVLVPDVQKDYRWVYASEWEKEPSSAIGALLEANEETLGVVMLFHNEPDRFDEDQLRLVEAAAKQIASAMNNADLYTLIREQAERLGAMVRREQVESTKNLAIVESIADGVMVANQDGEIVQFNSAAERILGLGRTQVVGSHISSLAGLYSSSGGQHWLDAIEQWTADPNLELTGQEIRAELSLDNGRFISVILSPVNIGDQFLGTVSVFRDITREIEVDRMKSEFVATVSHELRTPMTSIKGYADLLLLGAAGQVSEQQQKFLATIKTNADRLSLLVNELLDISRLDRGAIKLNLQPTNVAEVIELSLRQLEERVAHDGKQVDITSYVPDDLPLMRADFDKMTQVMSHLLNNAYSYTYAGGRIRVEAAAEERSVMIRVSDTGIGIPKEKQERIWSRFFRDEEQMLVMETSGAGLGLAIVREYVSLHQGDIWLESEPGKGTTFFVRIPAFTSAG